ncbi:putative translation initiation inhibitor, yjgF family [Thiorhodovibrio frisius]|uniref:Putative translation initiation inhibitor, yjgF family n=2 Tax=Thiorhodovibrio frisius TaxID=631362 RepID=H8Z3R6_9GAMM|nr:putative translation initiation inhibitor, yjgF family [Thiorhodovibrio frisius]WPL20783.1 Endoribonuclease L-PSP [Thiorhodovibrio frisius]
MECLVGNHLVLEYIVDTDALGGNLVNHLCDNDLLVLQERIVSPPEKLSLVKPVSDNPLVILNDSSLPVQRSVVAVQKAGIDSFERLDSGVLLASDDIRLLFSYPFLTGKDISFDSFNEAYRGLEALLLQTGFTETNIARTWFLVKDILRDYDLLNQVRDQWFAKWFKKGDFIPASTGIQSRINQEGYFSLECLAVDGAGIAVEQMHCSLQNEPIEYGKMFSRGILLSMAQSRIALISGTASTDKFGEVKYFGDIARQCQHMLDSVSDLLNGVGMDFENVAQAMLWLKHGEDRELCLDILSRNGFPLERCVLQLDCDVCRDEWLCEMEITAVKNAS